MIDIRPRDHRNLGRLLLCGAVAATAATATPAHAQVSPASVRADAGTMRYVGGSADNNVRFTLSGTTFTIDDVVPIQAGLGCQSVAGDPTKATCIAPKQGSRFKEFTVGTGSGNDKVVNATSTTVPGAPMRANGGPGEDELIGDLRVDDIMLGSSQNDQLRDAGGANELDGGSGDDKLQGGVSGDELKGGLGNDQLDGGGSDDQLDGGSGRDIIDGGPAGISVGERHDRVIYSDRTGTVRVDLTRTDASQGTPGDANQGIPAEGDTILDVEDVSTGNGNDLITGNQFSNSIFGAGGDDIINGREGKDVILGGAGNDFISPSPAPQVVIPFGAVPDGEADIIECGGLSSSDGSPGDFAFRVLGDKDTTNDCATVIDQ